MASLRSRPMDGSMIHNSLLFFLWGTQYWCVRKCGVRRSAVRKCAVRNKILKLPWLSPLPSLLPLPSACISVPSPNYLIPLDSLSIQGR